MTGIPAGTVLNGRYRLEERLGAGATAEVFRGTDELLGRPIAVKVFHAGISDLTSQARQRTEMQVLARLHHPNLVMVYDARIGGNGDADSDDETVGSTVHIGHTYLVMELVQGGTLADRIKPGGIPADQVARIGAAVAGALNTVHDHGLVHRDIKPANILLTQAGEAKLSDFGIARELGAERLTAAADVVGTAAYLSPEQARGGDVGPPTDIYALGLVLLECLTGRREFPGRAIESAMARLIRDPVVPASLPAPWVSLLRSMTQADPRRRPSAQQVEASLRGLADGTTVAVPSMGATSTLPQGYPALPPPGGPGMAGAPTALVGAAPVERRSNLFKIFAITLVTLAVVAFAAAAVIALTRPDSGGSPAPGTVPTTISEPETTTTPPTTTRPTTSRPPTTTVTTTPTTTTTPPTTTTPTTTTEPETTTTPPTTTTEATTPTRPTAPTQPTAPATTAQQPPPTAATAVPPTAGNGPPQQPPTRGDNAAGTGPLAPGSVGNASGPEASGTPATAGSNAADQSDSTQQLADDR